MSSLAGEEILLDGKGPFLVVRLHDVSEVCELVREASAQGQALFPTGGRTLLDYGLPPARPGRFCDLRGLQRVVDYPAADMTVTVELGLTLADLQRVLRERRQWLPLDVPLPERSTLGGAVATNLPGPRRFAYGNWRDYVLGLAVVNDQGELTRSGGRVVKNVAGYDLHKLHIGALGTLGIMTEATFKVRPLPETRTLMCWCSPEALLPQLLDTLHTTQTRPVTVSVLDQQAAQLCETLRPWAADHAYLVLVGFEEKHSTVAWQLQQVRRELTHLAGCELLAEWSEDESMGVWQWLADFPLLPSAQVSFRASVLPSQTPYLLKATKHLTGLAILAHAESGTVYGQWSEVEEADLRQHLEALRSTASTICRVQSESAPVPGRVVLLRCPTQWKTPQLVWGDASGDLFLQRKIKETFDPRGLFNPGRFPAGW